MDPTDFFSNPAIMNSDIIRTEHYTRRTHVIPASQPRTGDVSVRHGLGSQLRLAAHEYLVVDAKDHGYTIILTHGTSFNKFFWELVIAYLLLAPGVKARVKRLIAIDAANHGDSAVLNGGILPSKGLERPTDDTFCDIRRISHDADIRGSSMLARRLQGHSSGDTVF